MIKIYISNIEVGSISNIGSLNIGKTILSSNQATSSEIVSEPGQSEGGGPTSVSNIPQPQPIVPPVQVPDVSRSKDEIL
jgi:hypothetical protein